MSDDNEIGPARGILGGLLGYNLKRAWMIFEGDLRAAMGEDGMSPRVFAALTLVVENPEITQSALARTLGIERSGMVAMVDDMERRGFVERRAVPGDRRAQALVATDAGQVAMAEAARIAEAHEARLLVGMEPAEIERTLAFLHRIRTTHEQ